MNSSYDSRTQLEWFSIFGILALVGLVYSPIVTNSFNGDDFVHLQWLQQAVSKPELIWRNFHSSWLDLTTAKFYRPLISIFMLVDYLTWHGNGIGFHLTNLFSHLANTLLLWMILKNIVAKQYPAKSINHSMWCLSAAALFGLYPLHTEAVSWITGRVDIIVTLFFLAAFYCYLRWRQSKKPLWLCLSIVSFICSLLSKEMAVVFPAVILIYELIFDGKQNRNIIQTIKTACLYSMPFWLILFAYFLLRYYALGTFVGGYDNTSLSVPDWRLSVSLWKHSLYMLFIPFNQNLLTGNKLIIALWMSFLLLSLAFALRQLFLGKDRAIYIFLCSWLLLSLLPVYKVFNIGIDLQGARLAYLATVPLCMLICFGLSSNRSIENKLSYWQIIALTFVVSVAGAGLLVNNSAWTKAEQTSQAISRQFNELSKTDAANSVIYVIGLPDQIDGAYVCRNALDGMTKYPQISKDIHNCFNLSEINNIFPFGYAQRSMTDTTSTNQSPRFYVWHQDQQKLEQFQLPAKQNFETIWSTDKLKSDLSLSSVDRSCIDIDFIIIAVDAIAPYRRQASPLLKSRPYLIYKNDLHPEGARINALPLNQKGEYIFPLHSQVDWMLGGQWSELKIGLSAGYSNKATIKSVAVVPATKIMPTLSFQGTANQNIIGYIELDQSHPSCRLSYDISEINGPKAAVLELTPPNTMFAVSNDPSSTGPVASTKNLFGLSGSTTLTKENFPEPGIYALRLRALGENNRYIGTAGDHIIVTVR